MTSHAVSGATGTGVQFVNCHVHHNGLYDPNPQGSYQGERGFHHGFYLHGSNHLIDQCVIEHQEDGYGVQAYTNNITISNSIIRYNFNGMILIGGSLVYNNLVVQNGVGIFLGAGSGQVLRNSLEGNREYGVLIGPYTSSSLVANTIIRGSAVGILAPAARDGPAHPLRQQQPGFRGGGASEQKRESDGRGPAVGRAPGRPAPAGRLPRHRRGCPCSS